MREVRQATAYNIYGRILLASLICDCPAGNFYLGLKWEITTLSICWECKSPTRHVAWLVGTVAHTWGSSMSSHSDTHFCLTIAQSCLVLSKGCLEATQTRSRTERWRIVLVPADGPPSPRHSYKAPFEDHSSLPDSVKEKARISPNLSSSLAVSLR